MERKPQKQRSGAVWKFGYGSNISPEYARSKKNLNVLDCRRCVLKDFTLSFPKGKGLAYVEPSFATLRKENGGMTHGTCLLLPVEDVIKLDQQENNYNVECHRLELYEEDDSVDGCRYIDAEVYAPRSVEADGHPQGPCSERYRNVLLDAAKSVCLAPEWITKLESLTTYQPSEETLAMRSSLPVFDPMDGLPYLNMEELKLHDGRDKEKCPVYISICGYIFKNTPFFRVYWGRDYTYRMMLHCRGISLDLNDDGGIPPFPKLREITEPHVLEYVLQQRDRVQAQSGKPVAVLKEFWNDQRKGTE